MLYRSREVERSEALAWLVIGLASFVVGALATSGGRTVLEGAAVVLVVGIYFYVALQRAERPRMEARLSSSRETDEVALTPGQARMRGVLPTVVVLLVVIVLLAIFKVLSVLKSNPVVDFAGLGGIALLLAVRPAMRARFLTVWEARQNATVLQRGIQVFRRPEYVIRRSRHAG